MFTFVSENQRGFERFITNLIRGRESERASERERERERERELKRER